MQAIGRALIAASLVLTALQAGPGLVGAETSTEEPLESSLANLSGNTSLDENETDLANETTSSTDTATSGNGTLDGSGDLTDDTETTGLDTLDGASTLRDLPDEGGDAPCWQGPTPEVVICQLPPTCQTVFKGDPICEPPEPCTDQGDGTMRCIQRPQETTRPDPAVTIDPLPRTEQPRDDEQADRLRGTLVQEVRIAMSSFRDELDALRHAYHAGLDTLETRYEEAKSVLQDRYEACLEGSTDDEVCREQARDSLDRLRASLRAEGQALLASLLDRADAAAERTCEDLARSLTRIAERNGLLPGTITYALAPEDLALCASLHPDGPGAGAATQPGGPDRRAASEGR